MRKGWLLLAAGAIVATCVPARAATLVLVEGDITLGNPFGGVGGGISEIVADCDPDAPAQGVDGITFEVPGAARGKLATLDSSGPGAFDVDVYWYDANCRPRDEAMNERGKADETGTVPLDAVIGVVDLVAGANAHVKVSVQI